MKKDCFRVFIAVGISDEVRKELARVLIKLRRLPFSIKWVEPENLHLTLAFLGDLERNRLPALYRAVEKSRAGVSSFLIQPTKIVCLPSFDRPRVIVLGSKGETFWLEELQKALEKNLSQNGFDCRVKPAHLTLGRVRSRVKKMERVKLGRKLADFSFPFQGEIFIDKITVFRSELSSQGPVYASLKEFRLF